MHVVFTALLGTEWLDHAERAGDAKAAAVARAALAGDGEAQLQVVRWEVGVRLVAERRRIADAV